MTGLSPAHPCSRDHGHNYRVEIELQADELDATGFVVDYRDLSRFGDWLDRYVDHRDLNTLLAANPTAEHLAAYFYHVAYYHVLAASRGRAVRLSAVRVSETEKTWAEYRPPAPSLTLSVGGAS